MATLGLRSLSLLFDAGWISSYMYNDMTLERARKLAVEILLPQKGEKSDS